MKKIIYIAGPYTAPTAWQRERNIRVAEAQSLRLWRAGIPAVCVHSIARHFYGEVSEVNAIMIDDALLAVCHGVLLCSGWEESAGTRREVELANAARQRIFFPDQFDDCVAWAMDDSGGIRELYQGQVSDALRKLRDLDECP